jgi:urease accessory protein
MDRPEPSDAVPTRLLLLLDGRAPAGAHSHSGGMEAAVSAGMVRDLDDVGEFCRGVLHTAGAVAAAFAASAWRAWNDDCPAAGWAALDDELSARLASEARRGASRSLGSGLRRLLRALAPDADITSPWATCAPPAPHHALVLGAGCSITGGTATHAARAAALGACVAPTLAAVRLLGLDPYRAHGLIAELHVDIEAVADRCAAPAAARDLPAATAPALDLLAEVHLRESQRLFAS